MSYLKMISIKKERVLVSPKDIVPSSRDFEVLGVLNPGAVRLPNKDILLYLRVIEKLKVDEDEKYYYAPRFEGKKNYKMVIDKFKKEKVMEKNDLDFVFPDDTKRITFISHLRKATLDSTGFKLKSLSKVPDFFGLSWDGELGIEDARITKIDDLYVMTYVSLSRKNNISTSYAISHDCINWYRRGIIFREQNKDVAIFPEVIKKRYVAYNRPEGNFSFSSPHIWLSYSPDLQHWGNPHSVTLSKKGTWDSGRVGAGPPPLKTKKGWLLIYHGVIEPKIKEEQEDESFFGKIKSFFIKKEEKPLPPIIYCAGGALLDLKNPKRIIAKSKNPLIMPSQKYERGTFEDKKVFFPTGLVPDLNGKDVLIFSGGGDRVTTVKKVGLSDIFQSLEKTSN